MGREIGGLVSGITSLVVFAVVIFSMYTNPSVQNQWNSPGL